MILLIFCGWKNKGPWQRIVVVWLVVLSSHPCRALEDALLAGLSRLLWLVLAPALCRPPTSKTMAQWFRCQITSTHWCREALSSTSWGITTIETLISECTGLPHGPEWQGAAVLVLQDAHFYIFILSQKWVRLMLGNLTTPLIWIHVTNSFILVNPLPGSSQWSCVKCYTTWVHPVRGLKHQSLQAKLYA